MTNQIVIVFIIVETHSQRVCRIRQSRCDSLNGAKCLLSYKIELLMTFKDCYRHEEPTASFEKTVVLLENRAATFVMVGRPCSVQTVAPSVWLLRTRSTVIQRQSVMHGARAFVVSSKRQTQQQTYLDGRRAAHARLRRAC